jgi:hypothetical protein
MAQMKRKRWYTDSVRLIRKERNSLVTAQFIYWLDDWTTRRLDDWTTGGTTGDGRLGTDDWGQTKSTPMFRSLLPFTTGLLLICP